MLPATKEVARFGLTDRFTYVRGIWSRRTLGVAITSLRSGIFCIAKVKREAELVAEDV